MSKRSSVQLVEREEPSFIKKFKAKVDYVEPCTVEDKFNLDEKADDLAQNPVKPDETPAIVVLPNSKDITQSDIDTVKSQMLSSTEASSVHAPFSENNGKIKFQTPLSKLHGGAPKFLKTHKTEVKSKEELTCATQVANQNLLSFTDEDDESD